MSKRPNILRWSVRLSFLALALAGLIMLALPGIARALGLSSDGRLWPWTRDVVPAALDQDLLTKAGLDVSARQWRQNLGQWDQLTDAQRQEILARCSRLQNLDSELQTRIVKRYQEFEKMPPADRDQLRRQAAGLAAFETSLSRQDLAELDGLSPQSRAKRLIQLWQAAKGLQ